MSKVTLLTAAAELEEFWSQHTVGEANGNLFKVAKGIGSTNWHQHDDQDEVFVVLSGEITVQLQTGDVDLNEGDLFIVPRGVEHRPQADNEVLLLLVGPEITSTLEGGNPDWSATSQAPQAAQ